jgi:hypothetical protein
VLWHQSPVQGEGLMQMTGLWLTFKELLSGIQRGKTFFNLMFLNVISSRETEHILLPEACVSQQLTL